MGIFWGHYSASHRKSTEDCGTLWQGASNQHTGDPCVMGPKTFAYPEVSWAGELRFPLPVGT